MNRKPNGVADESRTLGRVIAHIRREREWTLKEMSGAIGIPLSTLAKVESNKLSLNYDKLMLVADRLNISMASLLSSGQDEFSEEQSFPGDQTSGSGFLGRRSVTREANTISIETKNYDYAYLCTDLREKRIIPILTEVKAKSLTEFGDLVSHKGEEFIFVLKGSIEVHTQLYTPIVLKAGEGIYIDSGMGHAYLAKDCDQALTLAVCSGEDSSLETTLMTLAEESE